ncbi:hypothetical protein GUJ93_ZPchr0005g16224 [Zizania palustris]|uniref:Endonuclease/exonuclease/phosphatase domain-containing protein n=1 Tax=Zizania palustris TaxID=103762 RepID=A0A8J5VHK5_ZIZPA|nr:hypothetical protein GUJ93_ZPchr0005g16224 [Zizania palustris]
MMFVNHHVVVGGDFNLIRSPGEKSKGVVNRNWMDAFNEFINDNGLGELPKSGGKFTWSNRQVNPTREVLDRVLVSNNWVYMFPLALVVVLPCIGSDHSPLLVDLDKKVCGERHRFKFDNTWLMMDDFREWVISKWPKRGPERILDFWKKQGNILRRIMRGWGAI